MGFPDLTTLGAVTRSIRDFPDSDEVKIAEWITAASDLIRDETGHEFRAPAEVVTLTLPTYNGSRLYVPELMARADIVSVVDDYGTPRTFTWSQPHQHRNKGSYIIVKRLFDPRRADELPRDHADDFIRNLGPDYTPNPYGNEITITAKLGYDQIPQAVNVHAETTVRRWYYKIANFAHSVEREESGTPGQTLPPSVMSGLMSWRVPRRAVLTP